MALTLADIILTATTTAMGNPDVTDPAVIAAAEDAVVVVDGRRVENPLGGLSD